MAYIIVYEKCVFNELFFFMHLFNLKKGKSKIAMHFSVGFFFKNA